MNFSSSSIEVKISISNLQSTPCDHDGSAMATTGSVDDEPYKNPLIVVIVVAVVLILGLVVGFLIMFNR